MDIITTARTSRETQAVTCAVSSAEPSTWGYGRPRQRQWRITNVFVRWERARTDGGVWQGWRRNRLTISGLNVKADGSDGAERSETRYDTNELPDEIRAWIDAEFAALPE